MPGFGTKHLIQSRHRPHSPGAAALQAIPVVPGVVPLYNPHSPTFRATSAFGTQGVQSRPPWGRAQSRSQCRKKLSFPSGWRPKLAPAPPSSPLGEVSMVKRAQPGGGEGEAVPGRIGGAPHLRGARALPLTPPALSTQAGV